MAPPLMAKDSNYLENFSPLNGGIPPNKIPLTESLKNTYDRVVPYYDIEINKNLKNGKNILISAHGNSLISQSNAASVSYPDFWTELERLRS